MKRSRFIRTAMVASALAAGALLAPKPAYAHCDTMDGPVVKAAQHALDTRNLQPMLIWVRDQDEAEVRRAFEHTLEVRRLGKQAAALADTYFFETVVRVHRQGEGEPFTGLKPAGTDIGHAVPATDRALASGSVAELRATLIAALDARLNDYFAEALARKSFDPNDVEAGRRYVEAYVRLTHLAEEVEALTTGHDHAATATAAASPHDH